MAVVLDSLQRQGNPETHGTKRSLPERYLAESNSGWVSELLVEAEKKVWWAQSAVAKLLARRRTATKSPGRRGSISSPIGKPGSVGEDSRRGTA